MYSQAFIFKYIIIYIVNTSRPVGKQKTLTDYPQKSLTLQIQLHTHLTQIYKYKYSEYVCGVGTSGPVGKQATPTLVRANNALCKARMTPSYGFLDFFYILSSKRVNP